MADIVELVQVLYYLDFAKANANLVSKVSNVEDAFYNGLSS